MERIVVGVASLLGGEWTIEKHAGKERTESERLHKHLCFENVLQKATTCCCLKLASWFVIPAHNPQLPVALCQSFSLWCVNNNASFGALGFCFMLCHGLPVFRHPWHHWCKTLLRLDLHDSGRLVWHWNAATLSEGEITCLMKGVLFPWAKG